MLTCKHGNGIDDDDGAEPLSLYWYTSRQIIHKFISNPSIDRNNYLYRCIFIYDVVGLPV